MKKRVLVFASNSLHNGPRMIREIDALKNDFDIVTIGKTAPHIKDLPFYSIDILQPVFSEKVFRRLFRLLTNRIFEGRLPFYEKKIHRLVAHINPDIVIAHNPTHLPYLLSVPNRKFKVVYNAHEYYPLEFDNRPEWLKTEGVYFKNLYAAVLPKLDLLINVCKSIVDKCKTEFEVDSLVIPNSAYFQPTLKPYLPAEKEPIKIIHHGGSIPDRKIELMIDAVASLGDDYQLDLMLMASDKKYHQFLLNKVSRTSNVRMIDPVSYDKIVPFINQYDIGLYNLPPNNYNEKIALPNKLFEYIQARLAIVIGPSVEMQRIVNEFELGLVSDSFSSDSIARTILSINRENIWRYKQNSDRAAAVLCAEEDQKVFKEAINKLIKDH